MQKWRTGVVGSEQVRLSRDEGKGQGWVYIVGSGGRRRTDKKAQRRGKCAGRGVSQG